jgi:lysozyme family protein
MTDLTTLTRRNAERWAKARITRDATSVAERLCAGAAKVRYQVVARETRVPWFIVAVIHEREASQNWISSLAQGDPWNEVSVHVPKGRGPFPTFERAAVDALVNCAPYAARWKDWSAGGAMTLLEQYNGIGYAAKSLPSPYVWSGTDQYEKGKFVADGIFDPSVVDKQLGCACIIKAMMVIDPTITFTGVTIVPPKPPPITKVPAPQPQSVPARQPSFWAAFFTTIASIFKRKS